MTVCVFYCTILLNLGLLKLYGVFYRVLEDPRVSENLREREREREIERDSLIQSLKESFRVHKKELKRSFKLENCDK